MQMWLGLCLPFLVAPATPRTDFIVFLTYCPVVCGYVRRVSALRGAWVSSPSGLGPSCQRLRPMLPPRLSCPFLFNPFFHHRVSLPHPMPFIQFQFLNETRNSRRHGSPDPFLEFAEICNVGSPPHLFRGLGH